MSFNARELDDIFRAEPDDPCSPATITHAIGGAENDFSLFLERSYFIDPLGEVGFQNTRATGVARSQDVHEIKDVNSLVSVHGYLTLEDGTVLEDEGGDYVLAENLFSYKIQTTRATAAGVTEMTLQTPLN